MDPEMLAVIRAKSHQQPNLQVSQRDFIEEGCGLPDGSADYAMLFNILHAEEAAALLIEARRVLKPGGTLAVMHWNYDPSTPRGPSMDIRPRPEDCLSMVERAGFTVGPLLNLPPHHYGFSARRP
jgi:predicted methyltransferase